jgi:hypothetical protein
MLKKICITLTFISILIFSVSITDTFAAKCACPKDYKYRSDTKDNVQNYEKGRTLNCPDDCKCGPDVNCKDNNCEKATTDTCICK